MATWVRVFRLLSPASLVVLAACGGSTPPARDAQVAKPSGELSETATEQPTAAKQPITSLKRSDVKETIARGVGAFLQNVTVEDWPVMHGGKFHGFKIKTINPGWNVDIKPGDVITRVNGIVPEHPEEADAALRSLEKAPSLRIDFERDGQPRTLELPIVD
jgi:type II secretory pathway component PulC